MYGRALATEPLVDRTNHSLAPTTPDRTFTGRDGRFQRRRERLTSSYSAVQVWDEPRQWWICSLKPILQRAELWIASSGELSKLEQLPARIFEVAATDAAQLFCRGG